MLCHSSSCYDIDQHNCNSVTLDLIGKTPQATVEMIQGEHINTSIKIHSLSQVVITCTDAGWTTQPDGASQKGQLFFHRKRWAFARKKNQTCLTYAGTRIVCNVWQHRQLQQKLKQQQMTKIETDYTRMCLMFCFDSKP